jgi:hypothetical protein
MAQILPPEEGHLQGLGGGILKKLTTGVRALAGETERSSARKGKMSGSERVKR